MSVVAHQGGWDEILFVLAPLIVFGALLALARKRVGEIEQDEATPGGGEPREARDGSDPT